MTDGPSNRDAFRTLPNAQAVRAVAEIVAVGVGNNVVDTELVVGIGVGLGGGVG